MLDDGSCWVFDVVFGVCWYWCIWYICVWYCVRWNNCFVVVCVMGWFCVCWMMYLGCVNFLLFFLLIVCGDCVLNYVDVNFSYLVLVVEFVFVLWKWCFIWIWFGVCSVKRNFLKCLLIERWMVLLDDMIFIVGLFG